MFHFYPYTPHTCPIQPLNIKHCHIPLGCRHHLHICWILDRNMVSHQSTVKLKIISERATKRFNSLLLWLVMRNNWYVPQRDNIGDIHQLWIAHTLGAISLFLLNLWNWNWFHRIDYTELLEDQDHHLNIQLYYRFYIEPFLLYMVFHRLLVQGNYILYMKLEYHLHKNGCMGNNWRIFSI